MSINVPQLIFTGITKFAPQAQVEAEVGNLLQERLVVQHACPIPLSSLKMSAAQGRLANEILRQLEAGAAQNARLIRDDGARRLLYALLTLGIVATADDRASETPHTHRFPEKPPDGESVPLSVSVPVTVTSSASGSSEILAEDHGQMPEDDDPLDTVFDSLWVEEAVEVEVEIEMAPDLPRYSVSAPDAPTAARDRRRLCNEIMADYLTVSDKDPFDLLGVAPDAPRPLIREKYVELCDKYAPWRFEAPQLRAVSEKADELLRAVILAFAELTDEKRRRELLARRENDAPKRGQILPASHFAAGAEELAGTYRQRGHELLTIGHFSAASDLFSLAADSDPENPAVIVDLLYAHARQSRESAARSLQELASILERDPACTQACFYAAEIAHSLGHLDRAETYFSRGCELWSAERAGA
jgi:tetratricopeptide (TPR) repeat protein